jgi:HK97 family phage major capsid protein
MSTLSKAAILEIHDLTSEARRLAGGSQADRKTADVLLMRCANIRESGLSSDEMRRQYTGALIESINGSAAERRAQHEVMFQKYFQSRTPQDRKRILTEFSETEKRDFLAGKQAITYTEGGSGGVLVPNSFYEAVTLAMAQVDPLLDQTRVNLIPEPGYAMNPKSFPGYDLTQVQASLVSESSNTGVPDAFPVASGSMLNGYIFRMATYGSVEIDDDDFELAMKTIGRAHGVGLARGIGSYLVTGTGASQPSGLLTGASFSNVICQGDSHTGAPLSATDIFAIYFSLNRVYRAAPKCAWVMADATYQEVRKLQDANYRPLLQMRDDTETLMGKPVLISPSMPTGAGSNGIVFGDLSHFNVRCSPVYFRKVWEVEYGVESYRYLHISRMRVDSAVFNPAQSTSPSNGGDPIVYATLHA